MQKINKKIKKFKKEGFVKFSKILENKKCRDLYLRLKNNRSWNKELFMSEKVFQKNPQMKKTNPGKGIQNLIDEYNTDFIEKNDLICKFLNEVLGNNWEIILSKFVVAVPYSWMPKYVRSFHKNALISNFNPFIKKRFRDVTYFHGIDYHMDSRDNKGGTNKFITMYIYLNDVDLKMSPLNVIKKSHKFGHTTFPHLIKTNKKIKNEIFYKKNNKDKFRKFKKETLTGITGSVYFWTSNTLHGTMPSKKPSNKFRISVRYLIKKSDKNNKINLIDKIIKNNKILTTNKKRFKAKRILI